MFFWGCKWETRVFSPPFLLSRVLEISSFALLASATQAKGKLPCLTVYRALKVSSISVLSTDKRKLKSYMFPLLPRRLSRERKGRREGDNGQDGASPSVCTLPMVPCGSSPVARLYLAKNEAPEEEADVYELLSLVIHLLWIGLRFIVTWEAFVYAASDSFTVKLVVRK